MTLCFPSIPETLLVVGRFALASVVYHSNFLKEKLPPSHLIFSCPIFTNIGIIEMLRPHILCKIASPGDSVQQMVPMGIPPDILLALQISALPNQLTDIIEERTALGNMVTPHYIEELLTKHYNQIRILHTLPAEHQAGLGVDEQENQQENSIMMRYYTWGGRLSLLPDGYILPKVF
jgi:hypothetical protein